NPDLTGKDVRLLLSRVRSGAPGPVEAFKQHGEDFVVAGTLPELVAGMNRVTGEQLIDAGRLRELIEARDRQVGNGYGKDAQLAAIHEARSFRGDKYVRVVPPNRLLDPKAGPLIAVRLSILTRKTLGGLHTDL